MNYSFLVPGSVAQVATLWLPWVFELHSLGAKKWSKIATALIFFPVKAESAYFSNLKKGAFFGAFSRLYLVLKYKICFWKFFFMYRIQTKIYTQKSSKKSFFFQICKVRTLSFHWKKINTVAILDRFAAHFETKLILASRRLVVG